MKECKVCKKTKSLSEFHPHKSCKGKVRPECKTCHNKISKVRSKKYIKTNPLKRRSTILKNKYGINYDDYLRILGLQGGGCAICGSTEPGAGKTYFSVDHNHTTGKNRGLLCHPCNAGLGMFKEDKLSLKLAIEYLEKWNG
jgi:hypothetical protein